MSSSALPIIPPATDQAAPPALEYSTSKSFGRMVFEDTFKNHRARAGILWIAVLVFFAVFAPFLANSHPILMKVNGRWSSPLLVDLTQTDATLLVAFAAAIVLMIAWGITWSQRLAILLWIIAVTLLLVWWPSLTEKSLPAPSMSLRILIGTVILLDLAVVIGILWRLAVPAKVKGILIGAMFLLAGPLLIFPIHPLLTFVAFFGRNLYLMMAIIGFVSWTGDARFVRAEFLRLRKQDFVQAAIAQGLPLRSILFRHMLPNAIAPVLVGASFGVASAILYEATLSFLGLGLVDEPSWGQLLNQVNGSVVGQLIC